MKYKCSSVCICIPENNKKDITNGNTSHVHELENLILLRWLYSSIYRVNVSYQTPKGSQSGSTHTSQFQNLFTNVQ